MGDYDRFEPLDDEISLISGAADLSSEYSELAEEWYLLGKGMYELGNYAKARPNLEKALKYGNKEAAYYLGELYYSGLGTERDCARAYEYYTSALNTGIADVNYKLGRMSLDGEGTAADYAEAKRYLEKAFELGIAEACHELGRLYEQEEDYKKAAEWYKSGIARGDKLSMCGLGAIYFCGRGVNKNYVEALRYYSMAKGVETTERLYRLGWMCRYGKGMKRNDAKAHEYYSRAAAPTQNDDEYKEMALNELGSMHQYGLGCEQNLGKAITYYMAAALLGNAGAYCRLGGCYEYDSNEVKANKHLAYFMYQKAADLGDAEARRELADGKWDEYKLF